MNKEKAATAVFVIVAGIILVPLAWNFIIVPVVNGVGVPLVNAIKKARYDHKIKKGLKEGSIVYYDGKYYTIQPGLNMTAEDAIKVLGKEA